MNVNGGFVKSDYEALDAHVDSLVEIIEGVGEKLAVKALAVDSQNTRTALYLVLLNAYSLSVLEARAVMDMYLTAITEARDKRVELAHNWIESVVTKIRAARNATQEVN